MYSLGHDVCSNRHSLSNNQEKKDYKQLSFQKSKTINYLKLNSNRIQNLKGKNFLSKRLHFLETSSTQMFTNLSQNYQKVNDVFSSTLHINWRRGILEITTSAM